MHNTRVKKTDTDWRESYVTCCVTCPCFLISDKAYQSGMNGTDLPVWRRGWAGMVDLQYLFKYLLYLNQRNLQRSVCVQRYFNVSVRVNLHWDIKMTLIFDLFLENRTCHSLLSRVNERVIFSLWISFFYSDYLAKFLSNFNKCFIPLRLWRHHCVEVHAKISSSFAVAFAWYPCEFTLRVCPHWSIATLYTHYHWRYCNKCVDYWFEYWQFATSLSLLLSLSSVWTSFKHKR